MPRRGRSHWSLVTPPGVADNGGLVESASGRRRRGRRRAQPAAALLPLAQSTRRRDLLGHRRSFPGRWPRARRPRLRVRRRRGRSSRCRRRSGADGARPACRRGPRWSLRRDARAGWSPGCGVHGLDGAALLPERRTADRAPAAGGAGRSACSRGPPERGGSARAHAGRPAARSGHHRAPGAVDGIRRRPCSRRQPRAVGAPWWRCGRRQRGRGRCSARWRSASGASVPVDRGGLGRATWPCSSAPEPAARVRPSTSTPAGPWDRLPRRRAGRRPWRRPPARSASGGPDVDAFTVDGESLGVFALTPLGRAWAEVQSSQVPLAYGSSS